MNPLSFTGLCEILVRDGGLRPTLQVTVEEQVAKILYLLAHNVTNCELSFIFRRFGESNYLRGVDPNDELLAQVDAKLMNDNTVHEEVSNSREMVDMAKKAKEFTLSYLNVQENFVCNWTNMMDDTLVDAYCHEDALGHRVGGTFTSHTMDNIVKDLRLKFPNKVKLQAAELKNKSFRNYEKLMMLYGKDRAAEKHAETGSDMLKRNAHKNPKKSSADSFTIDEIDEMGYTNTDSLKDMEVHEQGYQSQATNDAPTPNVYQKHQRLPEIKNLNMIILKA
ncbi:hypothetical protein T459_01524 [Capsicum annuum]|uniref:DUF8040 domain-containing protein n=1 Tax=Capsicum annuum TaxID=4072 RepID=A0A2G3AHC9_CAPAN|nr:hypothetical protein T459_01524 [Capsicum annuum]